jgi:hypothetical protein
MTKKQLIKNKDKIITMKNMLLSPVSLLKKRKNLKQPVADLPRPLINKKKKKKMMEEHKTGVETVRSFPLFFSLLYG